jgi:mono/diheme cytochrome c family protein
VLEARSKYEVTSPCRTTLVTRRDWNGALAVASFVSLVIACSGTVATTAQPMGGKGGGSTSGIPCDVQLVLQTNCQSCHGSKPAGGAPMSLLTLEDLTAPSVTDPSKKVAEACVTRMQSTTKPMPPTPASAVADSDISVFQAWIASGYKRAMCTTDGVDAGPSPYDTDSVCTSNVMWKQGTLGSTRMQPGNACIACHSSGGGPDLSIAGTVYATAHEPGNCNGGSSVPASVVITGADGVAVSLPVNAAGNFYSQAVIALPYTAKVVSGGKTRAMAAAQMSGDCNSCHTEAGANSAPGRIMLP